MTELPCWIKWDKDLGKYVIVPISKTFRIENKFEWRFI